MPRSELTARDLGRIALGGALGTGVRMLLATGAAALLLVNVLGAAALGALHGHLAHLGTQRSTQPGAQPGDVASEARAMRRTTFLASGFLGGLTTFSTMVVVAGRLGHDAGLVDPGSGRMSAAGLTLAAAYLATSVLIGLLAFLAARTLAVRTLARTVRR
jgi:fluoride ion exporter CrcB/FEX